MKLFLCCAFVVQAMFAAGPGSGMNSSSQDFLKGDGDAVMEALMRFAMTQPELHDKIQQAYLQTLEKSGKMIRVISNSQNWRMKK